MNRPNHRQIADARQTVQGWLVWKVQGSDPPNDVAAAMQTLVDATASPTYEEIADAAAKYSTGMIFTGTAAEDALTLMTTDNVPRVPDDFARDVFSFMSGCQFLLGRPKRRLAGITVGGHPVVK